MTVKRRELNSAPRTAPLQSAATLGMLSAAGGERERCKVGYTVLYTMLIGDVRQAAKDHSSLDWSFFGSFATHSVSMHT